MSFAKKTNHFQNKNDSAWRILSRYKHPNDIGEKRCTIHRIISDYYKCEKSIGQTFRSLALYPGAWKAEDEKKNRFLDLKLSVKSENFLDQSTRNSVAIRAFLKLRKPNWSSSWISHLFMRNISGLAWTISFSCENHVQWSEAKAITASSFSRKCWNAIFKCKWWTNKSHEPD